MQATTLMFAETKKPRKASVRTMEPLFPERLLLARWGEEFVLLRGVQAPTYCWKRCRHIFHKNKKRTSLELHLLISGKVLFRLEMAESNMSFQFFQLRAKLYRTEPNVPDTVFVMVTPSWGHFGGGCSSKVESYKQWSLKGSSEAPTSAVNKKFKVV